MMLFVNGQRRHEVRAALERAGCQFADFAFDNDGLQVWRSQCV